MVEISTLLDLGYLISATLFIFGIKMLSSPKTAPKGNMYGAVGMLVAVLVTVLKMQLSENGIEGWMWIIVGLGVGAGIVLGVATGLILGISSLVREISLPPILLLRTIPIMALIPLFLFWFGTREIGIIIFVIFAVFSIMIVSTLEAIRNVPRILLHHAQCLGATKMQSYKTVVIPYILPALNGSIRVILGISFALVLAGELLATDRGLGWLMILSERYLQTGRLMVIVIIFIIYTMILNVIYIKLSNKINHWKN